MFFDGWIDRRDGERYFNIYYTFVKSGNKGIIEEFFLFRLNLFYIELLVSKF